MKNIFAPSKEAHLTEYKEIKWDNIKTVEQLVSILKNFSFKVHESSPHYPTLKEAGLVD